MGREQLVQTLENRAHSGVTTAPDPFAGRGEFAPRGTPPPKALRQQCEDATHRPKYQKVLANARENLLRPSGARGPSAKGDSDFISSPG